MIMGATGSDVADVFDAIDDNVRSSATALQDVYASETAYYDGAGLRRLAGRSPAPHHAARLRERHPATLGSIRNDAGGRSRRRDRGLRDVVGMRWWRRGARGRQYRRDNADPERSSARSPASPRMSTSLRLVGVRVRLGRRPVLAGGWRLRRPAAGRGLRGLQRRFLCAGLVLRVSLFRHDLRLRLPHHGGPLLGRYVAARGAGRPLWHD